MVSQYKFFGGATETTTASNVTLAQGMNRLQVITTTAGGVNAILKSALTFKKGGPHFFVVNLGANFLRIRNAGLTTIAIILQNQVAEVHCVNNSTVNGVWMVRVKTIGSAGGGLPADYHYWSQGTFGSGASDQTYEYNQQLDAYTTKTASLTQRTGRAAAFRHGAAMHLCGGESSATYQTNNTEYDPDTWTARTALTTTFGGHAGAHILNKSYIFGGASAAAFDDSTRTRTHEYASSAWTTKTPRSSLPGLMESGAAKANNDKVYCSGGRTTAGSGTPVQNIVDEYVVDTWTSKQSRPLPEMAANATVALGDDVYSFGGGDNFSFGTYYGNANAYSPLTNSWSLRTTMPEPVCYVGGSSVGDIAQLIGGYRVSGGTVSDKNYAYDPLTDAYTAKTVAPKTWVGYNQQSACTR